MQPMQPLGSTFPSYSYICSKKRIGDGNGEGEGSNIL